MIFIFYFLRTNATLDMFECVCVCPRDCCGLRLEWLPKFHDLLYGVDQRPVAKFLRTYGVCLMCGGVA
jgi:hypothetical protein